MGRRQPLNMGRSAWVRGLCVLALASGAQAQWTLFGKTASLTGADSSSSSAAESSSPADVAAALQSVVTQTNEQLAELRANFTQNQLKQCLALRMGQTGAEQFNIQALMVGGARRRLDAALEVDRNCSLRSSYMVLVDQFSGIDALGGTRSKPLLDHNITNFKIVGAGLGCFIVSLDACAANLLEQDSRIALTFPLDSEMKQPGDFEEALKKVINPSSDGGVAFDSLFMSDVNDTSATGGAATASSSSGANATVAPIVFHVTLVDDNNVMQKLDAWKASLQSMGVDPSAMTIDYSSSVEEGDQQQQQQEEDGAEGASSSSTSAFSTLSADDVVRPVTTRYMIVKDVPRELAKQVAESLALQTAVEYVEVSPRLLFLNKYARGVTQSGDYQVTPLTAFGLDGTGQIIGLADTGLDMNSCFLNDPKAGTPYNSVSSTHRKLVTYIPYADQGENFDASKGSNDPIGHGTHVSGTVVGSTTNAAMSQHNGMASNAKLAFFDIAKYDKSGNVQLYPPGDLNTDMLAKLYAAGARIFSMSWGSPDSNCYSSYAVMVDEFMWNNPDALVVFAAGNSGTSGSYSVVTPSTAKSCVTVGASYNMMQTSFGLENNIQYVAYFSSIGPTADGRLKPDVVAPGYYIRSAHNGETCGVVDSRGTSMATPVVAGNAALLRQYLMSGKYQNLPLRPSGALLKALLIHSAQRMTAYEDSNGKLTQLKWPDYHQGYGRIQDDQVIDRSGRYTLIAYGTHNQSDPRYRVFTKEGDEHNYQLTINANASSKARPLKVTLVWTDRPASAVSCQQTKMSVLINDLDLKVTDGDGNTYWPQSTGGSGPDRYNPVEQIVIPTPTAGGNYTVTVTAHGLVTAQNYALVISGRFAGFQYNETSADVQAAGLWGFVQGHTTAVILICVAIAFSVGVCCCCLRRRSAEKRSAADLFDGPAVAVARTVPRQPDLMQVGPHGGGGPHRGAGGRPHGSSVGGGQRGRAGSAGRMDNVL